MSSFTISPDTGIFYLPLEFPLEHGGVLVAAQLAFERIGPRDGPVVIVLGGISAGRDITGWWHEIVGIERAIGTSRCRVIGIDFLGGGGVSTGPRHRQGDSEGDVRGQSPGERAFPLVTSRDQARALALLLEHLHIDRVHRFAGSSYGGMVGLAFAAEEDFSDRLDGLVTIGEAHESHPMASAWRGLQRRIVAFGEASGDERTAVALARELAMTTYRSHEEFGRRFARVPFLVNGAARFPVDDYLEARGADFAARFTADEFLALSQAIDLHRVDPAAVRVPTLLIGFDADQLVPVRQLRKLIERLGEWGRLIELPSLHGHDGFLKESVALTPILRGAIAGEVL